MRLRRIKEVIPAYYHIVSRIVDRRMILDGKEKERLHTLMRKVESFCGVQVLTYTILDNHFHILLFVPERRPVTDDELLIRMAQLYDPIVVKNFESELKSRRKAGLNEAAEALKAKYVRRMYDLSEFMKTLKQRYTQSYNRRHGRKGTLWEERFKSILLQGRSGNALAAVAAYIDLNPIRAGIVKDPKNYRFCGYGEAVAGSEIAKAGLTEVLLSNGVTTGWSDASRRYRELLYLTGEARGLDEHGKPLRLGFDPQQVQEVLDAGGEVTLPELLRCRVRYFTDGVVLGSRVYVEDAFQRHRAWFSAKRKTGARPMRGGFPELFTVRRLQLDVITAPATG